MTKLSDMIEEREYPDRELDCRIWSLVTGVPFEISIQVVPDFNQWVAPHYTTSLDASITLCQNSNAVEVLLGAINKNCETQWLKELPRYVSASALRAMKA